MKDKIMPPLVLTIICIVVSGLLVLAYNATYVDNTGVLTDDMKKGCEEIFGKGDYEIMLDGEGDSKTPVTFDTEGVNSIITDKDNGRCVIEITEDGYSKGGLHLLIGINSEGTVEGIEFLSIGETPGLGTKVQDDSEHCTNLAVYFWHKKGSPGAGGRWARGQSVPGKRVLSQT